MHCFYVKQRQIREDLVCIEGTDVNHIKNVLRKVPGSEITVCDSEGSFYHCRLRDLNQDVVTADVMEILPAKTELSSKFYLFQGLPKKDKMEFIIQKAVELGVFEIIPVSTKYCVAKLEDEKKERKKRERWQAISEAAAKQSGRGIVPNIHPLLSYQAALSYARELTSVLVPYELATGSENSLDMLRKAASSESVGIFIGPEGGFSNEEIALAIGEGAVPVTLGKRILRTETAGLAVLSYLMLEAEAGASSENLI